MGENNAQQLIDIFKLYEEEKYESMRKCMWVNLLFIFLPQMVVFLKGSCHYLEAAPFSTSRYIVLWTIYLDTIYVAAT